MSEIDNKSPVSFKHVLFATDFSSTSRQAAAYVKTLALRFSSSVTIAHVFDPVGSSSAAEGSAESPSKLSRRSCEQYLEKLRDDFCLSGIAAETALSEGYRPFPGLLKLAKDSEVDLIVAGTGSTSSAERLVLGSTAEQLIRNAECAVLTVGPKTMLPSDAQIAFRRIVCAADLSPEAIKAAHYALSLAEDSSAHIYFCYVLGMKADSSPKGQLLENAFQSAIKQLVPECFFDRCHPEFVVQHGDAAKAILELAAKIRADLIVLGARSTSFWLTNLNHDRAPNLLVEAICPVMTVS